MFKYLFEKRVGTTWCCRIEYAHSSGEQEPGLPPNNTKMTNKKNWMRKIENGSNVYDIGPNASK